MYTYYVSCTFYYSSLPESGFPLAKALTFEDPDDLTGIVACRADGSFIEPPGGWIHEGRTYIIEEGNNFLTLWISVSV